ncbi:MAG: ABC transporter [Burkholderiales bacterium PBB5]|nr:MAG: ABC transporter [Burkholderiales bacterium PBB5]
MAVVQVTGLRFAFDGEPPLFDGLALSLEAGVHRLDGESGSGKTTLMNLLAGRLACTGQRVLNGLDAEADPAAWRQSVAWVDARDPAFDELTPEALMQRLRPEFPRFDTDAWQRHIDGFGLTPHAFKTLYMMSTGMRRKAALAVVLASGCPLLLLDEPTAGLDAPSTAWLVAALNAGGQARDRAALVVLGTWPANLACASTLTLPGP